jgi:hypothetical protein
MRLFNDYDNYAKDFIDNFEGFFCDDEEKQEECYYNMERIVEEWGERFPDDADYICAYVILKIPDLSEDELVEYFRKARYLKAIDAKHHLKLLEYMTEVSMMKIGEERYFEFMKRVKNNDCNDLDSDNRNYAQEFLEAYKNNDIGGVADVFNDWTDSEEFDSNYHYAKALIYAGLEGKTLDDAVEEFKEAEKYIPADIDLEPQLRLNSWEFIKMRAESEGKLITLNLDSNNE